MAEHPITPPHELVQQWASESLATQHLATQAARWGADQELEACCEWIGSMFNGHQTWADELRVDRRPKPPSLKERAFHELNDVYNRDKIDDSTYDTIRRALETLPE